MTSNDLIAKVRIKSNTTVIDILKKSIENVEIIKEDHYLSKLLTLNAPKLRN